MANNTHKSFKIAPIALALSLSLTSSALAGPGDINSTNNGGVISGGTYYNTADGKTTFVNQGGAGGLVLPSGQTIRGLEVNAGKSTGNGGTLHFYAPGGMVRLDGNVDVSGLIKNGSYIGNGGRVFVDSAMLFQNGTIFANGLNGGMIQFNVGSAMFGPGSRVEAQGFGGLAGTIGVNASGVVDIAQGAIFDASGRSINTQNLSDNVNVNITGSLVNNAGIIRANAINIEDGHVTFLPAGDALELAKAPYIKAPASISQDSNINGGVIRVVSTGQTRTDCVDCIADKSVTEGILTTVEANLIKTRQAELVTLHEGDVINTGTIQANGGTTASPAITEDSPAIYRTSDYNSNEISKNGGNGGTIIVSAADDIVNDGLIQANGGDGADASLYSSSDYARGNNDNNAPGKGGNGGTISLSAVDEVINGSTSGKYKTPSNATIEANGGNGGSYLGSVQDYDSAYHTNGTTTTVSLGHFDSESKAENAVDDKSPHVDAEAYADASDYEGAQGGNGGVIGISYGNKLTNNGTIAAEGGNGGNGAGASADASSYTNQSVKYTYSYKDRQQVWTGRRYEWRDVTRTGDHTKAENAYAYATAKGGEGGDGGKGGLVVLSGATNPTGNGIITVNGGKGGNGGNASADASAESTKAYAEAKAYAYGGDGGKGGKAGYVVTPNPGSASFNYSAKDGNSGIAGKADAYAYAEGKLTSEYAKAYAKGNDESTAHADAYFNHDDVDVVHPTFDWSNNSLLTTQNNELLLNGNSAILMTKGSSYSQLTDRLDDATARSVDAPFGWAKADGPIRHFVVASTTPKQNLLVLDKPYYGFDGLTSLTVTTNKNVTVPGNVTWTVGQVSNKWFSNYSSGGGHLSIVAPKGTFINGGNLWAFGTHTGGSISIAAQIIKNGIDNQCGDSYAGTMITTGLIHGGSIILKGSDLVENLAVTHRRYGWEPSIISTSGLWTPPKLGGTIRLQSFGTLFNEGQILANGLDQGGVVIAKAGAYALNNGFTVAKAYNGTGGFIRWHGNALSANLAEGTIDVSGYKKGGIIQLTAGGPTTESPLGIPFTNGLGITLGTLQPTDNPTLVNSADILPLGSAVSAGTLEARGKTLGQIDIAGDGFAGLEAKSIVNGVTVGTDAAAFFGNSKIGSSVRLVAGEGAVKAVACGGDIPEIPENPPTPETPIIPPVISGAIPDPFKFDILGLPFQNQRPYLNDRLPVPTPHKLVIRLGQPNLYMSRAYASVTQEILSLALKEYNRELSSGQTVGEALRMTQLYLGQSGVDAEVASQLIEAIEAGEYKIDAPVITALKGIITSEDSSARSGKRISIAQ